MSLELHIPVPDTACLVALGIKELGELRAMIENHWRHNVGTAGKADLQRWQNWIDELTELIDQ